MDAQQKYQHEIEQPLEPKPNLQEFCQLLQNLVFVFPDLDEPKKARKLNQFVKSADSGDSGEGVVLGGIEDEIEGNDGQKIYDEPASQVVAENHFAVLNQFHFVVVKGGVHNQKNVDQKKQVDAKAHWVIKQRRVHIVREGDLERSHDARAKQHQRHDNVPHLLHWVLWINNELPLVLAKRHSVEASLFGFGAVRALEQMLCNFLRIDFLFLRLRIRGFSPERFYGHVGGPFQELHGVLLLLDLLGGLGFALEQLLLGS